MKNFILAIGFLMSTGALAQVPTSGMISYYSFSGNADDLSGNNQHGTVYGAVLTTDRFGNLNSAYSFNGQNSYIQVPESLLVGLNTYSFSLWARPAAISTNYSGVIYSIGDENQNKDQMVTYDNSTEFYAGSFNTGNILPFQSKAGSQPMAPGQWVHLAVVRDSVKIKLYVNGALQPAVPDHLTHNQPAAYGSPTRAIIGARSNLGNVFDTFFNGAIDDLRHYDRVLNPSEVNALYNESLSGNRITGAIFRDSNGNGVQDAAEMPVENVIVRLDSAGQAVGYTSSNLAGNYTSYALQGTYAVSIPQAPLYHTYTPASHQVTFTGLGGEDSLNHFALSPIPNMNDLRVTLTSFSPPRPGFDSYYQISYKNVGTTVLSGAVHFLPDSQFTYLASSPVFSASLSDTLTWNFSNLNPGDEENILVTLNLPATAVLGDQVNSSAIINPIAGDQAVQDNISTLKETIIGSYDPNDKAATPDGNISPQFVQNGEFLVYKIRFQNTGTAAAINVAILDTLSPNVNISSFEILAASHPFTFTLRDNEVKWSFNNIMLPDSNTNEPASHGFILYRVLPNSTLQLGDIIENTAYIYFDFNAPVVTNTTFTEVALPVSALEDQIKHLKVSVYPNPTSGSFTIKTSGNAQSAVTAVIVNSLGQVVEDRLTDKSGNGELQANLADLPSGLYFVRVTDGLTTKTTKLLLQK